MAHPVQKTPLMLYFKTKSITEIQFDEKSETIPGYKCNSCVFGEIKKDPNVKLEMVNSSHFVDSNLKVMKSPKDTLKVSKKEEDLTRHTQLESEKLGNLTRAMLAMTQTKLEPDLGNVTQTQETTQVICAQTLLKLKLGSDASCISSETRNDPNRKREPKAKGRMVIHQCGGCGKYFRYKSSINRHHKKSCKKYRPKVLTERNTVS